MSYHALARKYRPSRFGEMVGQKHVTDTLCAALRHDKLSHAYLFSGPRGCGKTTVARLLAKAINCTSGQKDDPCGTCDACRGVAAGTYLDVLEIDAASHTGVDNIRELRDMAQYSPSEGANRVFIIDEVHMLSKGAFNALLKILEEPPSRVFFFFATTEPNRVPRTILSRCQRFDFRLLSRDELEGRLREIVDAEGMKMTSEAMRLIVSMAEGSMRDGLSILDQVLAGSDEEITEENVVNLFGLVQASVFTQLNEAILAHDPGAALRLVGTMLQAGHNLDDFARELVNNFRNLLLLKIDPLLGQSISLPEDQIKVLQAQSDRFAQPDLLALLEKSSRGFERIHRSTQPRVLLEALLVELAMMESRVLLADLVKRLEALTRGGNAAGGQGGRPVRQASRTSEESGSRPMEAAQVDASAFRAVGTNAVDGWSEFISRMSATHPGLASCLLEGVPSRKDDTSIQFDYPAGKVFQIQQIRNAFEDLQANAQKWLGCRIVLELVEGDDAARTVHKETLRKKVAPTEQEALITACKDNAPLKKLVEILDAEVITEAEREDWLREPGDKS